jgi:hypothetical protein
MKKVPPPVPIPPPQAPPPGLAAGGDDASVTVDVALWPLVIVTFRDSPTDAALERMFQVYEECYRRAEPFHIINDGIRVRSAPAPRQRQLIAARAREHEPMSRAWVIGSVTVVPNALLRGIVTAITWLAPPVYPLSVRATMEEALDIAFERLTARGIPITPELRRFRRSLAGAHAAQNS